MPRWRLFSMTQRAKPLRESLTALSVAAALVWLLFLRVEPFSLEKLADSHTYIAMAESPSAVHATPFCYRVLTPTLARWLPFDLTTSFRLLTLLFTVGTGLLLYHILRALELGHFHALMGLIMFYGLNWGPRFALFDFRLTDPALFFFSAMSLLALLKRRYLLSAVTLSVAVLAKESAVFVISYAYTIRARRFLDWPAAPGAAVVSVFPIVTLLILHAVIVGSDGGGVLGSSGFLERLGKGMYGYLRGGTVGAWGVLTLVLFLFSGASGRDFALRSVPFLALVYLQPFYAVIKYGVQLMSVDRVLMLGFLAVIPIATMGLRRAQHRFRLAPWTIVGYVLIPYVLLLMKSRTNFNTPSPEKSLLFLLGWTMIVLGAKRLTTRSATR